MHAPCPPGKMHHKDSNGKPLKPGECWQDLHHHHHHSGSHNSSSGGSSGGSSSGGGGGHSYNITYEFVECEEGGAGCYQNMLCTENDDDCLEYIQCPDDDQDCQMWIKCDDDAENCMANINPDGWGDDGHNDDGKAGWGDDDGWYDDGWTSSNLDQGSYATGTDMNGKTTPIWPFLVAALVAGVIGAIFVVSRRKRRIQESGHPLDGAVKKRQRLFAGMNTRNRKQGALNEDFDNEDEKPNFIEISDTRRSYRSPQCDDSFQGSAEV